MSSHKVYMVRRLIDKSFSSIISQSKSLLYTTVMIYRKTNNLLYVTIKARYVFQYLGKCLEAFKKFEAYQKIQKNILFLKKPKLFTEFQEFST